MKLGHIIFAQIIARVEKLRIVKDYEVSFGRDIEQLLDHVIGIAPDAWKVILNIPPVNADAQVYLTLSCRPAPSLLASTPPPTNAIPSPVTNCATIG